MPKYLASVFDREDVQGDHRDRRHDIGRGHEHGRRQNGNARGEQGVGAETSRQQVGAESGKPREQEKCEMHGRFAPAGDGADKRHVIHREGGVLDDNRGRPGDAGPIDLVIEKADRVLEDVLRRPEAERVVDVVRLVGEGREQQYGHYKSEKRLDVGAAARRILPHFRLRLGRTPGVFRAERVVPDRSDDRAE